VKAAGILAGESPANGILLRGFACHRAFPGLRARFGLTACAAAVYPMYRGVASLVGMDLLDVPDSDGQTAAVRSAGGCDFVFLHHKPTDSSGEDGDFDAKTTAVESFDAMLPGLLECGFDVVCVTGDHSTPCGMKLHSWHPVPVLIHGGPQRTGWSRSFSEREALAGALGTFRAVELMPLLLASAGRMAKFGA
jgi:2,3-bisphosphoglycerate-independent phosphoglycerate mutase